LKSELNNVHRPGAIATHVEVQRLFEMRGAADYSCHVIQGGDGAEGNRMKPCPSCRAQLSDTATSCKHCGHDPAATPNATRTPASIIVTTGDIRRDYEILGPVYFQVSNKGIFGSALSKLVARYVAEMAAAKKQGQLGAFRADWGFLYGEWSVGQTAFDQAFFVAVQELKVRAAMLGADAVIGMRQDIDMDTTSFQFFYLQMYGTAVTFRPASQDPPLA
jgi:uncharacterized protein YbjQ (UPF0145 family)